MDKAMKYHTKRHRDKQGIPMEQPVNYRHFWKARMKDIKIYVLTMKLKEVAAIYNVKVSKLSHAMSAHGVSANVERHRNRLKESKYNDN
jgi:hypothetical protein